MKCQEKLYDTEADVSGTSNWKEFAAYKDGHKLLEFVVYGNLAKIILYQNTLEKTTHSRP
jgi:hypothetical protein